MTAVNPFPPLVFKHHYSEFNELHVNACKEMLASTAKNSHLESAGAYSSVSNQKLPPHLHQAFEKFFRWQQSMAEDIILNHLFLSKDFDYVVGNSWANVHYTSGKTLPHAHGLSALSCVAYITLPNDSGFTEFKDPHYDLRSLHERSDDDAGLSEWCAVNAVAGDVLFFPGWLQHRSQANLSSQERWIVSSNYVNFQNLKSIKFGNLWA